MYVFINIQLYECSGQCLGVDVLPAALGHSLHIVRLIHKMKGRMFTTLSGRAAFLTIITKWNFNLHVRANGNEIT